VYNRYPLFLWYNFLSPNKSYLVTSIARNSPHIQCAFAISSNNSSTSSHRRFSWVSRIKRCWLRKDWGPCLCKNTWSGWIRVPILNQALVTKLISFCNCSFASLWCCSKRLISAAWASLSASNEFCAFL